MKTFRQALKSLMEDWGLIEPEEEQISYDVVYEPNTKDEHGQWMSEEEVKKACDNFNKNLEEGVVKANLFHLADTELFSIEDSWIHKEFDVTVDGTGQPIKAGTWVAKLRYHDEDLWALKKAGVLGGVSFGGKAYVNEETGEITDLSFDGEQD